MNSLDQPVEHKLLFLDVGEDGFGAMYASSYHLGTGTDSVFLRVVDTDYLNGTRGCDRGTSMVTLCNRVIYNLVV